MSSNAKLELSKLVEESSKFKNEAIIFGNSKDRYRTKKLAEILERHEVDFYELDSDVKHKNKTYKNFK